MVVSMPWSWSCSRAADRMNYKSRRVTSKQTAEMQCNKTDAQKKGERVSWHETVLMDQSVTFEMRVITARDLAASNCWSTVDSTRLLLLFYCPGRCHLSALENAVQCSAGRDKC